MVPDAYVTFNSKRYNPASIKFAEFSKDIRSDNPLRAKSVCLAERPHSKYGRSVRSADPDRSRYAEKHFFHPRPQSTVEIKRRQKKNKVVVKKQKRKVIEKVPCAISVQTLSLPTKYTDDPKPRHSTSKRQTLCNTEQIDSYRTKTSNPPKQVGDNKRLCHTVAVSGKGTQNKLLLQISEAEQVADFERILNSNAILWERAHGHLWRGTAAAHTLSASVVPRPRSSYSLHAVSQAYHYLFRQHEESLQPLIDRYRQAAVDEHKSCPPGSFLENKWFETLQNLSEFYEDDHALRQEIETITDRIIAEEVKGVEAPVADVKNKNFNVNLADLIGLHVNGESFSPVLTRDELGLSPDVDKGADTETDEEKEWLAPIMSAKSDNRENSQDDSNVTCLAQNLSTVKIDSNAKVPTITFSNCCDGCAGSELPNNSDVVIHLAVPSIDSIDESRPPMM